MFMIIYFQYAFSVIKAFFVCLLGEDRTYEGSLVNGYEGESGDPQTGMISSSETCIKLQVTLAHLTLK